MRFSSPLTVTASAFEVSDAAGVAMAGGGEDMVISVDVVKIVLVVNAGEEEVDGVSEGKIVSTDVTASDVA